MRCWLCRKVIVVPDFTAEGITEAGSIRAGEAKPVKEAEKMSVSRNAKIGVTCSCGAVYSLRVRLESVMNTKGATEGEIEEERRRGWR